MALRINVLQYNGFIFRQQPPFLQENWIPTVSPSGSYDRQAGWQADGLADKIWLDFKILKILYRLIYLDFYFVYSSAMLLIVLEVYFSLLFSNKAHFRMCFVVCKIWLPFSHYQVLAYLMIYSIYILCVCVTGFANTIPNGKRIEIQFIAEY